MDEKDEQHQTKDMTAEERQKKVIAISAMLMEKNDTAYANLAKIDNRTSCR